MEVNVDFFGEILPPEVTHAILSLLSPTDLLKVSQVSKTFVGLLDSHGIWKRIVEEQFGPLNEEIFKGNTINWRRAFVRCSELLKWKKHFLAGYMQWMGAVETNKLLSTSYEYKPLPSIYFAGPSVYVLGFSSKYVLIRQGSTVQLWDLTVNCKHTDRLEWESSPNKEEICIDKCSFVKNLSITFGDWIQYKWYKEFCCVCFLTYEGITVVDLRTGEEIECLISFSEYGTKKAVEYKQRIIEVRVMPVDGVQMMFCHMQSVNGYLFINLTTKRVHLFVEKKYGVTWISKSLNVAIVSNRGANMRVVNIAQVHPKTLAKYHFKQRIENRVVSSPEGHVLFVYTWHYCSPSDHLNYNYEIRVRPGSPFVFDF